MRASRGINMFPNRTRLREATWKPNKLDTCMHECHFYTTMCSWPMETCVLTVAPATLRAFPNATDNCMHGSEVTLQTAKRLKDFLKNSMHTQRRV